MRKIIQSLLSSILFPTTKRDWYQGKGYNPTAGKTSFDNFLDEQTSNNNAIYYNEFQGLEIQRETVPSKNCKGEICQLDSIKFKPIKSEKQSGEGIHIINFFGRTEYYECNFRDMAREAHATGTTIHAFNHPGMNSSTGKVNEFKDLVNAGIAQINKLLNEGIHPDKIIIQGNCMGAAVAEEVVDHFNKQLGIKIRRINSNSFKSMNSLLANAFPILKSIKQNLKNYSNMLDGKRNLVNYSIIQIHTKFTLLDKTIRL